MSETSSKPQDLIASETARIAALVDAQRAALRSQGTASAAQRTDRIDRAIGLLVDHEREICEAVRADFGTRSADFSRVTEVLSPLLALKHARAHLAEWMKPEPRQAQRGEAWVQFQPRGVVGIISPWNFPVNLAFLPLAGALAAGNRVLIKPSELTPETSALLARMVASAFDPAEIAVVTGGAETGVAFSQQRFDHLLFTGATSVGREVMRAAAQNLVPVTLELGGKSPTIVSRSADLDAAVRKIMAGKLHNAGQVCLAPDYVFVPEEQLEAFVDAAQKAVAAQFPSLGDNPDYTAIITPRHRARLAMYLDDARERGIRVVWLGAADPQRAADSRQMQPALIIDPGDDAKVMQDEIFGPLLPVKPYRGMDEVLDHIEAHPRPLGLYYFGSDSAEEAAVLERSCSGGVTLGDVIKHVGVEDLPFGGVGPSGMGAYHGRDGFLAFSHARAVYRPAAQDLDMLRVPHPEPIRQALGALITR
ncbi:MAG: coniferyl aldehyde dehydrogenase [Proteobacteria bacterium]|nr:coniferyl aldehyde dehydrogenase [Pseudomonadota bacterium]